MSRKRGGTEPRTEKMEPMRDGRSTESEFQADVEADASFSKLRADFRIVLWLASASLVMTTAIFIAVFWLGRSI